MFTNIFDVVFHFDAADYESRINDWVAGFEEKAGAKFRENVETHIRDEYSTFNWIIEGMIKNAGFRIEKSSNMARMPNHEKEIFR